MMAHSCVGRMLAQRVVGKVLGNELLIYQFLDFHRLLEKRALGFFGESLH